MEEKVKEIYGCIKDLLGDKENKEIVSVIENKTKELIYENGNLAISKQLLDEFEKYDMNIGILNNTHNVPDQYIIYVSYKNEVGIEVAKVSKKDLIN